MSSLFINARPVTIASMTNSGKISTRKGFLLHSVITTVITTVIVVGYGWSRPTVLHTYVEHGHRCQVSTSMIFGTNCCSLGAIDHWKQVFLLVKDAQVYVAVQNRRLIDVEVKGRTLRDEF